MIHQQTLSFQTRGRGTLNLSREVEGVVRDSGITTGLCHVFVQHTSASLILCENADPQVRSDLERFLVELVPDGSPLFRHTAEGPDDMPAHVRSILTNMDLTLPVSGGALNVGIWQGIYLYEHRSRPHHRRVTITVSGE
ncbi:MAG TPA: YjbQ family protein [Thiolapillus brandeum]|uniref:YjbQ family protein n=1 Tax=Thiolapillus brandeum TaxID=1076588 RepID=A0A7C5N8T1_9GAMM|nr:YjbQ family protein [Thiolapillus brandeum]